MFPYKYTVYLSFVFCLTNFFSKGIQCSISSVRAIVDKKGREMAFIEGQDETGQVEFVCFSNQYERFKNILERGKIVEMNVRVQYRDRLSLIINQVKEL